MNFRARVVAVGSFLIPSLLSAATWTIHPDGTGDFPTIQAAVTASANGDEIVLTDGTFSGAGNRNVNYQGKAIVIRSLNGSAATTIDCGGQNGFLFLSGETNLSRLQDVAITAAGSAVLCNPGSPQIAGCMITASTSGVEAGVYPFQDPAPANPRVDDCIISACGYGLRTLEFGGIFVSGSTIGSCTYGGYSGGLGGSINATDCVFVSNPSGAGWSFGWSGGGRFTRCTFTGNASGISTGGAGYVEITDCSFIGNHGSAIRADANGATITRCLFVDNHSSGDGGVVFADAGNASLMQIFDSVFCNNSSAGRGGAIYAGMNVEISGNTFVNNSSASGGGAMHLFGVYAVGPVQRNIIAFSSQGAGIVCASGANPTLSCNDIFGNAGGDGLCGVDGGNNFSLDPLLCTLDCRDVGLTDASPCAPAHNACGVQIGARPVGCPPVPVLFQSVDATAVEGGVRLAWTISFDEEIAEFAVVRWSVTAENWTLVAEHLTAGARTFVDPTAQPDVAYRYGVIATTTDGDVFRSPDVEIRLPGAELALFQNEPNPFNPSTRISFSLPVTSVVDVSVFDVNGKYVTTLLTGKLPAGPMAVSWDGTDARGLAVSSGVYFCRLATDAGMRTRKMLLVK